MRNIQRSIEEVREIRGDLSNWLVHLTKDNTHKIQGKRVFMYAKECLERILEKNILGSKNAMGQFSHENWYKNVKKSDLKAVCFTETPIEEIFLFPNIIGKDLEFSSYGLVFDKNDLMQAPYFAAPVIYVPQPKGDMRYLDIVGQMETQYYDSFKDILFLFHSFGETLRGTQHDFRWEREWRLKGHLHNVSNLVKFALCPEKDIDYFEEKFSPITFVDPFFSPKQIEKKLRDKEII